MCFCAAPKGDPTAKVECGATPQRPTPPDSIGMFHSCHSAFQLAKNIVDKQNLQIHIRKEIIINLDM